MANKLNQAPVQHYGTYGRSLHFVQNQTHSGTSLSSVRVCLRGGSYHPSAGSAKHLLSPIISAPKVPHFLCSLWHPPAAPPRRQASYPRRSGAGEVVVTAEAAPAQAWPGRTRGGSTLGLERKRFLWPCSSVSQK